jgi:hypothetical protein
VAALARWCVRRRLVVVLLWLLALGGVSAAAAVTGSAYSIFFSPTLADGGTPRAFSSVGPNLELLVNADIEADADADGYGDETQDACPTDATTQGSCPDKVAPDTVISKAPKRKVKKGKVKLTFTSPETGTTFQCRIDSDPFKACSSPAIFKVKRGRHAILVRAVDAAGNLDETPAETKFKRVKKIEKKP